MMEVHDLPSLACTGQHGVKPWDNLLTQLLEGGIAVQANEAHVAVDEPVVTFRRRAFRAVGRQHEGVKHRLRLEIVPVVIADAGHERGAFQ